MENGKNKIMMIAIIVLLVILLVTVSIVSFFVIKNFKSPDVEEVTQEEPVDKKDIQLFTLSDAIYTNLKVGTDRKEHVIRISASIAVDMSDKKQSEEFYTLITANEVIVKDVIIGILREKTYEDLQDNAREVLREEILSSLQKEFNSNLIVTVYLSDIFIQ